MTNVVSIGHARRAFLGVVENDGHPGVSAVVFDPSSGAIKLCCLTALTLRPNDKLREADAQAMKKAYAVWTCSLADTEVSAAGQRRQSVEAKKKVEDEKNCRREDERDYRREGEEESRRGEAEECHRDEEEECRRGEEEKGRRQEEEEEAGCRRQTEERQSGEAQGKGDRDRQLFEGRAFREHNKGFKEGKAQRGLRL
jgi:hypothetical protein